MKNNCRKALAALVLVLAFSSSAFADDGIMMGGIAPPPPPPPSTNSTMNTSDIASTTEATGGIIHTDATDTLTEVGLSLLRDALTLL